MPYMKEKTLEIYQPSTDNSIDLYLHNYIRSIHLEKQLIKFIKEGLINDPDAEIEADTKLISTGLVDSFALVTIQAFIEKEFNVKVPAPRINSDSFDSITQMVSIIKQYI